MYLISAISVFMELVNSPSLSTRLIEIRRTGSLPGILHSGYRKLAKIPFSIQEHVSVVLCFRHSNTSCLLLFKSN